KEFVVTDANNKDWTFKFGDNVTINRGGKETTSDLKVGDRVSISFHKGLLASTAHYILVQEGDQKDCNLVRGSIKSYDPAKKQLTFTDDKGKDWTFTMGDVRVRLNRENSKIDDAKIGDHALAIVQENDNKSTLKCLMIDR